MYEYLKGSKVIDSELTIPGFMELDYEDLLDLILETILLPKLKNRNYYMWLADRARSYHRHRANNRYYSDFYDPLIEQRPEELTARQQLAIIKFHLYRRQYSIY